MKPIKTKTTELVYHGPTEEIGDLWCHRIRPGEIRSFWKPSKEELALLQDGGCVKIDLFSEPIPPLSVNVSTEESVGPHPFKKGE